MRILWVATKAPWPTVDGGRLVAALTLDALRARGHEITVVAPVDPRESDPVAATAARREGWHGLVLVPTAPASLAWMALRGSLGRLPLTVRRHTLPQVRDAVAHLVEGERFDVAHAEQLQALGPLVEAGRHHLPIVLRAQNVESDLWRSASRTAPVLGCFLRREAKRLAAWEGVHGAASGRDHRPDGVRRRAAGRAVRRSGPRAPRAGAVPLPAAPGGEPPARLARRRAPRQRAAGVRTGKGPAGSSTACGRG